MSDDQTTTETPPEEQTNEQLSSAIKALNESKGSTFRTTGNKDQLLASLAKAQAYDPSAEKTNDVGDKADEGDADAIAQLTEQATAAGLNPDDYVTWSDLEDALGGSTTQDGAEGTTEAADGLVDPTPDPKVDENAKMGAALAVGEMTGPDGLPLPQTNPEPADVAGPSGGGGDGRDNRDIAIAAAREADARYLVNGELPNGEVQTEGPQTLADEAPHYAEHTLPDRTAETIVAWADKNPDATVIPPTLLPPAYRDGTIATPGLPDLSV